MDTPPPKSCLLGEPKRRKARRRYSLAEMLRQVLKDADDRILIVPISQKQTNSPPRLIRIFMLAVGLERSVDFLTQCLNFSGTGKAF